MQHIQDNIPSVLQTGVLQKAFQFCRVCFGERFCLRPVRSELFHIHTPGPDTRVNLPAQTAVHLKTAAVNISPMEQLDLRPRRPAELLEKPSPLGAVAPAMKYHDPLRGRVLTNGIKIVGLVFHKQQGADLWGIGNLYLWSVRRADLNPIPQRSHIQHLSVRPGQLHCTTEGKPFGIFFQSCLAQQLLLAHLLGIQWKILAQHAQQPGAVVLFKGFAVS